MPATLSDNELLRGLTQADKSVLEEYYKRYYRSVKWYVLSNQGNAADAQDIFQDVLMVLLRKVQDGSLVLTCTLGTYIFSVSKILWLKELRKRRRVTNFSAFEEGPPDSGFEIIELAEQNKRLILYRSFFEKLSENCRRVLRLFLEGRSISEITTLMGFKSDQHTRNRRYRCKLALINSIRNANEHESGHTHQIDPGY